jgi:broad specificity phosphatase PhoE
MTATIHLMRHPPVAARFKGVCYGGSDVELEPGWEPAIAALAGNWSEAAPARVVETGLSRSRGPAAQLAQAFQVDVIHEPRLREIHLGTWELRTWDAIYAESGNAMDRLLLEPATFSAPGGETMFALRDRVMAAWGELVELARQLHVESLLVVTHGGPIATLRGHLAGRPVQEWPGLIPACGEVVPLRCGG